MELITTIETKRCPRCKETKSTSEYYTRMDKGKRVPQGYCCDCDKARRRDIYWQNPEKERRRSKKSHLRNGRHTSPEADKKHIEHKKAKRLALRTARASLITRLCMEEYEVDDREWLNGRHLIAKYDECVTHAIWLIRKRTLLSRDAIAEMFNCATIDVIKRIKVAVRENSWEQGDIIFRMKTERILKKYLKLMPTSHVQVEVLPFSSYSIAFRAPKKGTVYVTPDSPPEGITSDKVMEVVCWYYEVDWENFVGGDTSRGTLAKARQVYMFLINKYLGVSQKSISVLWDKDIATVSRSIKSGYDFMRADKGNLFYEMHKRFFRDEKNQTCPGEVMIS